MFKNGISQNTGKCKLGWLLLSQSQIWYLCCLYASDEAYHYVVIGADVEIYSDTERSLL